MKVLLQKLVFPVLFALILALPGISVAALIRCADCSRMVSTKAASCPECGRPMGEDSGGLTEDEEEIEDAPRRAPKTPPKAAFKMVRSALILIQSGGQSGSGFVVEIDGKLYVITNTHVMESLPTVSLRNLAGDKFKFTKAEFANDQDLVRLRLAPTEAIIRPLTFATDSPSVGEVVVVHGNSQGSDVVTELTGRVLGVGPNKIEVDAEFVQGNSGSPILNAQGEVIAVATYITQTAKDLDWVTDNTRFEAPRRFGIIPQDLEWVTVDGRRLRPQLTLLSDVGSLLADLSLLLENWRPRSAMRGEAADMLENYSVEAMQGSYTNTGWPQSIERFCETYTELARNETNVDTNGKRTAKVSKNSFQYKRLGTERDKLLFTVCRQAETKLEQVKWSTEYFQGQSDQYIEFLAVITKSLDQAVKSPSWGRPIQMITPTPAEWSARPGLQR